MEKEFQAQADDFETWNGFFAPLDDKERNDLLSLVNGYLSLPEEKRAVIRSVVGAATR